jgi:hypothetical protein
MSTLASSSLNECFHKTPSLRPEIVRNILNISQSFTNDDVDTYILPILSLSGISNDMTLRLFRQLLTARFISETWMRDNRSIFSDICKLLEDTGTRINTLESLHIILKNAYINISAMLRKSIWFSECRDTLFDLLFLDDTNVSAYAQSILLDILRFIADKNIAPKLTLRNIAQIQSTLTQPNICYFGIFCVHSLRHKYIKDILGGPPNAHVSLFASYLQSWKSKETRYYSAYIIEILMSWFQEHDYDQNTFSPVLSIIRDTIQDVYSGNYEKMDFSTYEQFEGDGKKLFHFIKLATEIGAPDSIISKAKDELEFILKYEDGMRQLEKKGLDVEVPNEFKCPITCDVMRQPVVASDGHSYEKEALLLFFRRGNGKSPLTRQRLNQGIMLPNINLKKRIREYAENICTIMDNVSRKKQCVIATRRLDCEAT